MESHARQSVMPLPQHHSNKGEDGSKGKTSIEQHFGQMDAMGLDDPLGLGENFNLEANLLDLSRISLGHQQDKSIVFDKDPAKDEVNESMVQETLQMMMSEQRKQQLQTKSHELKPPLKPKKSESSEHSGINAQTQLQQKLQQQQQQIASSVQQVSITHLQPSITTSQSDQKIEDTVGWKKVNINKKKRFTKKAETQKLVAQSEIINAEQQSFNLDVDLKDIQIEIGMSQNTSNQNVQKQMKSTILSKALSNNKYAKESEPLPLFDCLYCIGIHEHLALQTLKEKTISKIYGQEPSIAKLSFENKDQTYEEFNLEFKQNVRYLERMLTVQVMIYEDMKKSGLLDEVSPQASSRSSTESADLKTQMDFKEALSINTCQKLRPLQSMVDRRLKQISKIKDQQQKAQMPYQPKEKKKLPKLVDDDELRSDDSIDSQLCSNILGGFNDIDSDEQSLFINLNIRNRRQKILHKISFESQFFDIYNPQFSSQSSVSDASDSRSSLGSSDIVSNSNSGESNTGSYSSSSGNSSSSQVEDSLIIPVTQKNLKSKKNLNKWASNENTETRFPDLDGSEAPDRTIKLNVQNKTNQTKLKAQDLDYNSENNRSSLSSIHREIQEAPSSTRTGNNNIVDMSKANEEMETGGCQVEEMQNDTVVNKCNFMLANKGRLGEENESFSKQVKKEQQSKLKMLIEKQYVPNQEVCLEERSDLEDFSSGIDNMSEIQKDEVDPRAAMIGTPQQAKTTGRFNNFPLTTDKSQKQGGKKGHHDKISKAESDNHLIFLTQQQAISGKTGLQKHLPNDEVDEDDSIIQILPGLPSGTVTQSAFNSTIEQQDQQIGVAADVLTQQLAKVHHTVKGERVHKTTKSAAKNPVAPHPKKQGRDLTPDQYEEASSLSSGVAAANLYHHALNLVLKTSTGHQTANQDQSPPIVSCTSLLLDTEENEEDLLSPIVQLNQNQRYISKQAFKNPKWNQMESPSGKKSVQVQRKHIIKSSKMQSPDLTADAQIRTATNSGKKRYQTGSNIGIPSRLGVQTQPSVSNANSTYGQKSSFQSNIKNATQKISLNTRNNFQSSTQKNENNMAGSKEVGNKVFLQKTQQSNMRKSTLMIGNENEVNPTTIDFYSQMGKIQRKRGSAASKNSNPTAHSRVNSNKKPSNVHSALSNQMISASMGALPGLKNPKMMNNQHLQSGSYLPKSESQTVLPNDQIQTAEPNRRVVKQMGQAQTMMTMTQSKSKKMLYIDGGVGQDNIAVSSTTPVKQRQNYSGVPGRASMAAINQKSQNRLGKSEKQTSGKHQRQFATSNIGIPSENNKDAGQASQKGGTYGMLSKQQLKLMKQLEKQQQQQNQNIGSRNYINTQAKKSEVANTKIVIDNYFIINQDEQEKIKAVKNFQSATQVLKSQVNFKSKPSMSDNKIAQKKRLSHVSSPNHQHLQNLQRYISSKNNTGTKNTTPTQQNIDSNLTKYRSSMVENNIAHQNVELPKDKVPTMKKKSSENLSNLLNQKSNEKKIERLKLSASPTQKVKKNLAQNIKTISQLNMKQKEEVGNVVIPNLNLLTLDYQQQKTGSAQPFLEISGEELNQEEHATMAQRPTDENRKTKFQKFQSVKSHQTSNKHSMNEINFQNSRSSMQVKQSNYNTKIISQNDYSDSKSNYNNHATLSHLSSSQLEQQKHSTTYNDTGLTKLQKKLEQKLTTTNIESNIFNDDNTNFTMPAQSQRTRVSMNKLSISADKTPKPQNKDLLKSTIELGANNFSQIQADKTGGVYSCLDTKGQQQNKTMATHTIYSSNQKQVEMSKQSFEREIKQFKVLKEWKAPKVFVNPLDLNRESKVGIKNEKEQKTLQQSSESNAQSKRYIKNPGSQKVSGIKMEAAVNKLSQGLMGNAVNAKQQVHKQIIKRYTDSNQGTTALQVRRKQMSATQQQQPLQNQSDLALSSDHNEPPVTDYHHQTKTVNLPKTTSKAFDYKKMILENNQKLLKFQQQQTSQPSTQAPTSTKNANRQSQKGNNLNFIQSQLKPVGKSASQGGNGGYFTKQ